MDTFIFYFYVTPDCYNITLDNILMFYVLIFNMLVNTWDLFFLQKIFHTVNESFYHVLCYWQKIKHF